MDYLVTSFSSKCQRFLGKSWIVLQFLAFFEKQMSDFMKKSFFDLIELLVRFWRFCVFPCACRPTIIFSKLWPPYWFWCLFVFFWGLLCLFALSWVQGPWAQGPWAQGNFLYLSTPNFQRLPTPNSQHLSTPNFQHLSTPNFLHLPTPNFLHLPTPNFSASLDS